MASIWEDSTEERGPGSVCRIRNCRLQCGDVHNFVYCREYQNKGCCSRQNTCRFFHLSVREQIQYKNNKVITPLIWEELIRTGLHPDLCKQSRNKNHCSKLHCPNVAEGQHYENSCPVCMSELELENTCYLERCKHLLCLECKERVLPEDACPVCRQKGIRYSQTLKY